MSAQVTYTPSPNSLKNHWSLIDDSRTKLAKEIKSLANSISGSRAKQLRSVSRWFNSSEGYEKLLERPDVLCFCQPWVDAVLAKPNQEPLSELEMTAAVGVGFCKFENSAPLPRDLTQFLYPTIMFLAWMTVMIVGSIFLLPNFREMFEEFGIALPLSTQYVLNTGTWLEANWFTLFAFAVQLPLALWFFLWLSQRRSAYSLNWLDRRISRFRTKLSAWATHLASLLAVGVSETEAIQVAGRCSASSRLRSLCEAFGQDSDRDLLDRAKYPLINNALLLRNKEAKIRILEETARYYQAVSRTVRSWWLTWLSPAILVWVVATLFFVVASLFAPLISIISGLTGGF